MAHSAMIWAGVGKASKTRRPTKHCAKVQIRACLALINPAGRGLPAVRSTWASISRSTRSLKLQPAPRMAMEPMTHKAMRSASSAENPIPARPKNWPMKQGKAKSQNPIGRSKRDRRKKGCHACGARSTKVRGWASRGMVTRSGLTRSPRPD
jgi:hypothetical protein